jgi:hypothetical protein
MPKVGGREFGYTPEGLKKAEEYAQQTGQKVEYKQGYAHGGSVGLSHNQTMVEDKPKYMPKGTRPAIGSDPEYAGRGCGTRGMIGYKNKGVS